MENKVERHLGRERLKVLWRWQLWDKSVGITDVDLLLEKSWTQVEVQASLEVLLDQILIERHLSKRVNLLGQEIGGALM